MLCLIQAGSVAKERHEETRTKRVSSPQNGNQLTSSPQNGNQLTSSPASTRNNALPERGDPAPERGDPAPERGLLPPPDGLLRDGPTPSEVQITPVEVQNRA